MGLGDELLACGEARRLHARTQRKVRILDRAGRVRSHDLWRNIPYIAGPTEDGESIVNGSGARPYIAGKTDSQWIWRAYEALPGEIRFDAQDYLPLNLGRYILIEPNLKARPDRANKDWGFKRWQAVVNSLALPWLQVVQTGNPILARAKWVQTQSFRQAAAVLSRASLYVGSEGGMHHAAAALGVPAVVVFGGFISPAVTGYKDHANFFRGDGLGCGMRVLCAHCSAAMKSISVEEVAAAVLKTWEARESKQVVA